MEVINWGGDQLYMLLDCRSEERRDPSRLFVALVQDKGQKHRDPETRDRSGQSECPWSWSWRTSYIKF